MSVFRFLLGTLVMCPLCICFVHFVDGAPVVSSANKKDKQLNVSHVPSDKSIDTWMLETNDITANGNTTGDADAVLPQDADMWSVIWYLGAFGGLVTFFVVVTCSEWCFGNHMYTRHGTNEIYVNAFQPTSFQESHQRAPETPPPPYHLFAPPSYNDLFGSVKGGKRKVSKINIFIIPVHKARRSLSAPAAS